MSTFFRIMIAVTALTLAAVHFALPDLRIDITFFVLIAVALLVIFAPNIRIKALDLMGVKVEFEKDELSSAIAVVPAEIPEAINAAPPKLERIGKQPRLPGDNYAARLLKLTPVQTLAPYIIISSLFANIHGALGRQLGWTIFGVFLILTPYSVWVALGAHFQAQGNRRGVIWQTAISTIAFASWALALGGPFSNLSWYAPSYGALALTIVAFILPVVYVGE
jgi:hypothetical protein